MAFPYETLLKMGVKQPSFFAYVTLSVLLSREQSSC